MRAVVVGLLCALAMSGAMTPAHAGEATAYHLVPRSTILHYCTSCAESAGRPESLSGTFHLTPVNLAEGVRVEALTDVRWESPSFDLGGFGFVQHDAEGRLQVELRVRINGEETRLRSIRRQPPRTGSFRVVLATERDAPVGYLIVLTARAESLPLPDLDIDGVVDDRDNCPSQSNAAQTDLDFDGVGDACDQCLGTIRGVPVGVEGCSVEQHCPCDTTRQGLAWGRGAYAKCVAGAVRDLRRLGLLSRHEAAVTLRRALRRGCGQTVVATSCSPSRPSSREST